MKNICFILSVILFFAGCSNEEKIKLVESNKNNEQQDVQEGTSDGSGGDIHKIDEKTFEKIFERSKKNMLRGYERLFRIYNTKTLLLKQSLEKSLSPMGFPFPTIESDGSISNYAYTKSVSLDTVFDLKKLTKNLQKIANLKYQLQTKSCANSTGHSDASTKINGEIICINKTRILMIPIESTEKHLTALLAHEAGHALGLNEDDAVTIQNFFLTWKTVALFETALENEIYLHLKNYLSAIDTAITQTMNQRENSSIGSPFCSVIEPVTISDETQDNTKKTKSATSPRQGSYKTLWKLLSEFRDQRQIYFLTYIPDDVLLDVLFNFYSLDEYYSTSMGDECLADYLGRNMHLEWMGPIKNIFEKTTKEEFISQLKLHREKMNKSVQSLHFILETHWVDTQRL